MAFIKNFVSKYSSKTLADLVNKIHIKVNSISNDWGRRILGLFLFVLMTVIALAGCVIELIFMCAISVFKTIAEYFSSVKDDAFEFIERYIELW
jgi:hypothetical protein